MTNFLPFSSDGLSRWQYRTGLLTVSLWLALPMRRLNVGTRWRDGIVLAEWIALHIDTLVDDDIASVERGTIMCRDSWGTLCIGREHGPHRL